VCLCVCGAESKAAVAGISDILSFKDSLCTTRDDGENSCMLHTYLKMEMHELFVQRRLHSSIFLLLFNSYCLLFLFDCKFS